VDRLPKRDTGPEWLARLVFDNFEAFALRGVDKIRGFLPCRPKFQIQPRKIRCTVT